MKSKCYTALATLGLFVLVFNARADEPRIETTDADDFKIEQKEDTRPPGFTSTDALPNGPVLAETYIDDVDIKTLGDLKRLYRIPDAFRYEVTRWGQPVIRRVKDDALFSFLVEEGILAFDIKQDDRYDTSEIIRVDQDPSCQERWGLGVDMCVTGFARNKDGMPEH